MSSFLFAQHICFEHAVSSVITLRREEEFNNQTKVIQRRIDSQCASSCLINPHFEAGAVDVCRCAASFLVTEITDTVLRPRLMTGIANHGGCPPSKTLPLAA